ncbi:prolyl aminopeptidase [Legionella taurinensis]|uniref:Proline iminopeptidase n=1 Tax=Legionella taurinensis TaxID=70611 RepID=A0A3A5LJ19_9GAMM|nr:prolyl aminopeptidase [Legionella taurinensis]MDX1836470.1 prolyl aminopeptidase [Legionella taurinensis]PUT43058.1 prolyl aminopeptidase [Legionella taurinensis]PUT45124.1 prolyl aminopeptidase [Legionella taurinensis]PUT45613.1 prolyl aminopeptidase [Legionella taurinensis]PUT49382.1 prolyl aminopeptidase [Legionella taurinensis]
MHTLYPAIQPYKRHELAVNPLHTLYLEETGNPEGLPVMVLHPGPGAGGSAYLRRFFDPQVYRIIIFDQRGCGRSAPHSEIRDNTTQDLLDDIDAIRTHLGISRFMLFGGGWGSLLALLYAELYPQQIGGLLLHRIFLGRPRDVAWFYQQGASLIYPDYWQEFLSIVPVERRGEIPQYYAECLQGNNELARMSAAKNWALWQARCSSLQPHLSVIDQYSEPHFALALATLESHYIVNHYFIEENQVLNNAQKIRHVPTYLVHGRYDMVCPLAGAWDLHRALPTSNLSIVRDAGHSDREAGIIDALVCAAKEMARQGSDAC